MRKIYPSDLTDEQWGLLEPLIPPSHGGRPRTIDLRRILNGIFYRNRAGCQWRMLPGEYGPWETVYYYFAKWARTAPGDASMTACASGSGRRRGGSRLPPPAASTARRSRAPRRAAPPGSTTPARSPATAASGTSPSTRWGCYWRWW